MAKFDTSFNFGANAKPKKSSGKGKSGGKKTGKGSWANYASGKRK